MVEKSLNDPDDLAKACADVMYSNDDASRGLGISIDVIRAGYAQLSMTVRGDMTNGHKITHGGYVFLLADSAFAFACNSRNQLTVAQHCAITFLMPGKEGDVLTAIAEEQHLQGRSGIYDVTVTDQTNQTVAEFRGHSRSISGQHIPD